MATHSSVTRVISPSCSLSFLICKKERPDLTLVVHWNPQRAKQMLRQIYNFKSFPGDSDGWSRLEGSSGPQTLGVLWAPRSGFLCSVPVADLWGTSLGRAVGESGL